MRTALKAVGYLLLFLAGLASGLAVGMPSMIERAGGAAVARLSDAFGIDLRADQVDWSFDGTVTLSGLVVVDRAAGANERALLRAERATIDSAISLTRRRVKVSDVELEGVELRLVRRADGSDNFSRIASGLRRMLSPHQGQGGGASSSSVLRYLDRSMPAIAARGLKLVLDAPPVGLPLGLELPATITLDGGTLRVGPPAEGGLFGLSARFDTTSLDPGFGFDVTATVATAGKPIEASVHFDRAVRLYLGQRALGVQGLDLGSDGMSLRGLMLSVPFDNQAGLDRVGAALTTDRVSIEPSPSVLLERALARRRAGQPLNLQAVLQLVERIELTKPAVMFQLRVDGSHSFEDLVGKVDLEDEGLPHAGGRPNEAAEALTDATLRATTRLLERGPRSKLVAPLRQRVADALGRFVGRLSGRMDRVGRLLARVGFKSLAVVDGAATLHYDGTEFALNDVALTCRREADVVELSVSGTVPAPYEKVSTLKIRGDAGTDTVNVAVDVGNIPLSALGAVLPPQLGSATRAAALRDSHLVLRWTGGTEVLAAGGTLHVSDAALHHPALAQEALKPLDLALSFDALIDGGQKRLHVSQSQLRLGDIAVDLSLDVKAFDSAPTLAVALRLPNMRVQSLVDSLPRALIPRLEGLSVTGTLEWEVDAALDTVDPESLVIDSRPRLADFGVRSMGKYVDLDALHRAHTYKIRRADLSEGLRTTGPLTTNFVPLEEISPFIEKALTTTEDGSFYKHSGVSPFAMRESIVTNLKKGGFVRGGSTITQQLTKNLFLGPDKTVSRKLQELFIAWQVEETLTKPDIMALYLNVIEWGPGIYGIGDASRHYFAKQPSELTPLDAIFLASIIPSPRRHHEEQFVPGRVTERWRNYLRVLLGVMVDRGKLSAQEFAAAAPYDPVFAGRAPQAGTKPLPGEYQPAPPD